MTGAPRLRAASQTFSVPRTFDAAIEHGILDRDRDACLGRQMAHDPRRRERVRALPLDDVHLLEARSSGTFSGEPLERSSTTSTSSPRARSFRDVRSDETGASGDDHAQRGSADLDSRRAPCVLDDVREDAVEFEGRAPADGR